MGFSYTLEKPWLIARFSEPQRMLSWSITHPGYAQADSVAWLEVSDSDLSADSDACEFLKRKMVKNGLGEAVGLMTSRDIRHHHLRESSKSDTTAQCMLTLGLDNGSYVGFPDGQSHTTGYGTINILCHVNIPLSDGALVEASSIVTQAKTAALLDCHMEHFSDQTRLSGTGTDCIVVACPIATARAPYAGLHTTVGQAMGDAVYHATFDAANLWWHQKSEAE
jgi:adenosylcobinamide amidohydrolase